jgi:energy-coupling factor transporter ATP-binding protein EcfA2
MLLKTLEYFEHAGAPQEWAVDKLTLGVRNLIVGRNASGKTRIINVITALADNLSGRRPPLGGTYICTFEDGDQHLRYELGQHEGVVTHERVFVNDRILLNRDPSGEGEIWAAEIDGGKMIKFQTPPNKIAVAARQDSIQHPFLETLVRWGSSSRTYRFGTSLGQQHLGLATGMKGPDPDGRDQNATVALFRHAEELYGKEFTDSVLADMEAIGYSVESITLGPPHTIKVEGAPGQLLALHVREKGMKVNTDQPSMSQGMFRALALLIHFNYCYFSKSATCILIDDIGEGLDFERSCLVIDRIRQRAGNVQLIMTTNDRFVMNRVPLEEWTILNRQGGRVSVRNFENSRSKFEEFRFTGLSNFNFFELESERKSN